MRASIAFIVDVRLPIESSSLLEDGLYGEALAGSLRLWWDTVDRIEICIAAHLARF